MSLFQSATEWTILLENEQGECLSVHVAGVDAEAAVAAARAAGELGDAAVLATVPGHVRVHWGENPAWLPDDATCG